MHLKALYLHQFRNFSKELVQFSPGVNLLTGRNAQGKTNLVEALLLLATGRSFRTQRLSELIQSDQASFFVDGLVHKDGTDQRVSFGFDGQNRRISMNQTPCASREAILGFFRAVLLGPHDQSMIKGNPATRRQYLDVQLAQIDPLYVYNLARYHRAMKQRNVLVRRRQRSSLGVFEAELARSGAYLCFARKRAVSELSELAHAIFRDLVCFEEELTLQYRGVCSGETDLEGMQGLLAGQLEKERSRAEEVGHTTVGPHRDDLSILCGGRPAKVYASEGQQRLCVAAMRLAEWQRMLAEGEDAPVMVVDEVGISLDEKHRERLLEYLHGRGQVFLTSAEDLPIGFSHECLHVQSGKIISGAVAPLS